VGARSICFVNDTAPMLHLALSAVGRDRPGIVAAMSDVLLAHDGNLEDSQMTILRGHFAIMLVVSVPPDADLDSLRADLELVREQLDLEALALTEIDETGVGAMPVPSHMLSIYGVDHPGILQAVSSALAAERVNITDLTTRVLDAEGSQPLYAMVLEVAVPQEMDVPSLQARLLEVCTAQNVELSLRELESDTL
jgi:glycine cleavage system transcriptional repressor